MTMRMRTAVAAVGAVAVVGAGAILAQRPQNPGQIVSRPAEGRQPEFPPPSIIDYKPRSTLVVPQHQVPRAKFPAIDFHGHPPPLTSEATIGRVVAAMDQLNVGAMVNTGGPGGGRLKESLAALAASKHKHRFVVFTNVNLRDVGPGFGKRAAQQIEADVKAGAAGVGELGKNLGLAIRKADGTRLKVDDPELDPIFEVCARLGVPLFMHIGEPQEFFQPIDYRNERWLELALYADRRYNDRSLYPTFEELIAERDRMLLRHPKTTVVLAHLGWQGNNLAALGQLLDKLPNLHTEVGAVLYDFGRQPRTGHEFFVKYQDRILFGKDSFQPDEYPYFWRVLETTDEYFDYYRDYHAFWKLYGLGLPDDVLKKVYYRNALKVTPALSRAGFPQ
jgi:predicted TIM-barrel fold metal-dependent hydrolase